MIRRRPPAELRSTVVTSDEQSLFDEEIATHDRVERRLLWKELAAIAVVAGLVVVRQLWLQ